MVYSISREREAGQLYSDGAKAVRSGGHELRSLAMHLILMIKGTAQHPGALWPIRELPEGKVVHLDRFIDYLRRSPRDGLGLPSLYFLKQALEATPQDGERAIAMVRAELAKEHVDFDEQARRDELKLHGERPPQPGLADRKRDEKGRIVHSDNLTVERGTSAPYLAARLKRDYPEIAGQLAAGKFRSVRAAALAAGIVQEKTPLDQIQKLWHKLDREGRTDLRKWILRQCATCGREGHWMNADGTEDPEGNGYWCDACCDEGARAGIED